MPKHSILFLMGGVLTGVLGFGRTTGAMTGAAQGFFWVFLAFYTLSLIFSRRSIV